MEKRKQFADYKEDAHNWITLAGMREFQLWMAGEGIQDAFPDIALLALKCRFRECRHGTEKDCAVQLALIAGSLGKERFDNFLKLRREVEFLEKARTYHKPFGRGRSEMEKRKQSVGDKWRYTGQEE